MSALAFGNLEEAIEVNTGFDPIELVPVRISLLGGTL